MTDLLGLIVGHNRLFAHDFFTRYLHDIDLFVLRCVNKTMWNFLRWLPVKMPTNFIWAEAVQYSTLEVFHWMLQYARVPADCVAELALVAVQCRRTDILDVLEPQNLGEMAIEAAKHGHKDLFLKIKSLQPSVPVEAYILAGHNKHFDIVDLVSPDLRHTVMLQIAIHAIVASDFDLFKYAHVPHMFDAFEITSHATSLDMLSYLHHECGYPLHGSCYLELAENVKALEWLEARQIVPPSTFIVQVFFQDAVESLKWALQRRRRWHAEALFPLALERNAVKCVEYMIQEMLVPLGGIPHAVHEDSPLVPVLERHNVPFIIIPKMKWRRKLN